MTVRFQNHRLGFYILTLVLTGVVLGLAANFAIIFLPEYHRDFGIFSLVAPSLTILIFLFQIQWAQPRIEVVTSPILSIFWLTEAAWASDIIGSIQCDSLKGQTIPSKNGHTSFPQYCYKMKTIQALSWALFCAFVIGLLVLVKLASQARRCGYHHIWSAPINEMPWFGEWPGYPHHAMAYPQSPGVYQSPNMYHQPPPIFIQPGMNGAPPIVTQVPPMQA